MPWAARRLSTLDEGLRLAAEAIYHEAFPPGERIPFAELAARDGAGAARVEVVCEGPEALGVVALAPLATAGWTHLEYVAVASARRGGGIGGAVWRSLTARLRAEGGAVLLEIENPFAAGLDPAERAVRTRRQRFYTRLGARLLRAPAYAAPDAEDRDRPPIPMLLMAAPGRRAAMPAGDARRLVADLYATAYGLGEDDPLVRRALGSVR